MPELNSLSSGLHSCGVSHMAVLHFSISKIRYNLDYCLSNWAHGPWFFFFLLFGMKWSEKQNFMLPGCYLVAIWLPSLVAIWLLFPSMLTCFRKPWALSWAYARLVSSACMLRYVARWPLYKPICNARQATWRIFLWHWFRHEWFHAGSEPRSLEEDWLFLPWSLGDPSHLKNVPFF